jgi:hypothetical protein
MLHRGRVSRRANGDAFDGKEFFHQALVFAGLQRRQGLASTTMGECFVGIPSKDDRLPLHCGVSAGLITGT